MSPDAIGSLAHCVEDCLLPHRLQQRIEAIYIDKVDGKIGDGFHDRM